MNYCFSLSCNKILAFDSETENFIDSVKICLKSCALSDCHDNEI